MGILIAFTISTLIYVVSGADLDPLNKVTANVQPSGTYDVENSRSLFVKYVEEFEREYSNDEEYERRYNIFVNNLIEINRRNSGSESKVHGITKFADLTEEEFVAKYTGFRGGRSSFENETIAADELLTNDDAPEEYFDWRQQRVVTEIKNQGQCNSCWAFGAVGVTESQFAIKYRNLLSLSEQQMLDCWDKSGGCVTGNFPHKGLNAMAQLGGFMLTQDYPYKAQNGFCMFNKGRVAVKVLRGYVVDVRDEEELKRLVRQYGPVTIALYASSFNTYNGNIFIPNARECPANVQANHAVLLVGYGTENSVPYWIIKNSYGYNWGEQGYMRLVRGRRACSILQYTAAVEIV